MQVAVVYRLVIYHCIKTISLQFSRLKQHMDYHTVSVALKFGHGVVAWFWLKIAHEVMVKPSDKAAVISSLDWGCKTSFGLFHMAVDSWLLDRDFSSLPYGSLHGVAHDMASPRANDPKEKENPRWKPLSF